ncbi:Uncharacterized protein CLAVI_000778 [Candidatus Clavichlamydia salmonicola]|uniref:hemolysin family protein n=1 Tax=Candidatus Clavichlamydia salmonicola TaxID=469812 RepID=UPI001890F045|nr:hemolysin family protein [Candidatus Clavichlamydia salmonicola]MBF5051142.1 Uncharacterized protein [Candidatus Clavichlamydia salmonicola]
MIFLLIFFLLFLVSSSIFCSLVQISFFSLRSSQISIYKFHADPKKNHIARLMQHPQKFLVTLLFCDILANVLIQNTIASLSFFQGRWWAAIIAPLLITLVIGEVLPKALALPFNEKIAYQTVPYITKIHKTLSPFLNWMVILTEKLTHICSFFLKKEEIILTEELKTVIPECSAKGIISSEEAKLISGYLSLTDYSIKERMHPRDQIYFYDLSMPLKELHLTMQKNNLSRIPVCHGDLQQLVGICHLQILFEASKQIHRSKDLIPLLKKAYFIPETVSAKTALSNLIANDEQLGMVIDEYGAIAGLVTQEDLFELVVGEITDPKEHTVPYTRSGNNIIITNGCFELIEFENIFGVALPKNNDVATIGGWLIEQIGSIPETGTCHLWNNFFFHVLEAAPNKIQRVHIRRINA